jgi:hypothetical protein
MSPEQRASIHNGIWLCATCHNLVDKDWRHYPAKVFHDWKANAEAKARAALESLDCDFCGATVERGRQVCRGCHAEVAYGLRKQEVDEIRLTCWRLGGLLGTGLFLFFFERLGWSIDLLQWHLPLALLLTWGVAESFARRWIRLADGKRRQNPPRFFRRSLIG